jgi:hypothetical protein
MKKVGVWKVGCTLLLSGTMMLMACSTAWIGQAEEIVAALIPATANIVILVATLQGNVSAADLQSVRSAGAEAGADLQSMQSLIAQYQKADAAAQPGLLNQIQSTLTAVQATLNGLLPALHIKDAATEAKITAVVGILLAEVQSVAEIVPLATGGTPPAIKIAVARAARVRPPLNANEFAESYNATMSAKTGNAELDRATAGLRIHVHGKIERWASLGLLK